MTKILIIALIVIGLLGIIAAVASKLGSKAGTNTDVYYLRKALFTPAERSFLGVLEPNLPAGTRVFGKVRLEDIFGVKSGLDRSQRTAARNKVNRKHVDFLLVRSTDLTPIAGIELDDSSHEEDDRKDRDKFVDSVFSSAGIPLLHFPVSKAYNTNDVVAKISAALQGASRFS